MDIHATNENRIAEVLSFWFGDSIKNPKEVSERYELWFKGGKESDNVIADAFTKDVVLALQGGLTHWATNPRGRLALIILLDQFTRTIFRSTAKAFAGDEIALPLCVEGIEHGMHKELSLIERVFFFLPMEHSEEMAIQEKSVSAFKSLIKEAPEPEIKIYQSFSDYAARHRDVIRRFGRFPHRNRALGRDSTPEEEDFLRLKPSPF